MFCHESIFTLKWTLNNYRLENLFQESQFIFSSIQNLENGYVLLVCHSSLIFKYRNSWFWQLCWWKSVKCSGKKFAWLCCVKFYFRPHQAHNLTQPLIPRILQLPMKLLRKNCMGKLFLAPMESFTLNWKNKYRI